jgi:hypothetical protein
MWDGLALESHIDGFFNDIRPALQSPLHALLYLGEYVIGYRFFSLDSLSYRGCDLVLKSFYNLMGFGQPFEPYVDAIDPDS